jgi:hypothetical protein
MPSSKASLTAPGTRRVFPLQTRSWMFSSVIVNLSLLSSIASAGLRRLYLLTIVAFAGFSVNYAGMNPVIFHAFSVLMLYIPHF